MTDNDRAQARARGQAIRQERLARARSLRRRIIAGALALFVASWLLITIVLVSGHDPALAKNSTATTASSTPSTTTSSDTSSSQGSNSSSSSSNDTSSSSNGGSSGSVSSVTTSQS
jgi:cytoskeletal protein RodZ